MSRPTAFSASDEPRVASVSRSGSRVPPPDRLGQSSSTPCARAAKALRRGWVLVTSAASLRPLRMSS